MLWFWLVDLSAVRHNITHNLKPRISLGMIHSFILSLLTLHTTVNKSRDHQRAVINSTTTPDVLSNRMYKDQEPRDFACSSILYIGSAGSPFIDFKSLFGFVVFFAVVVNLIPRDCKMVSFISLICCMWVNQSFYSLQSNTKICMVINTTFVNPKRVKDKVWVFVLPKSSTAKPQLQPQMCHSVSDFPPYYMVLCWVSASIPEAR